MLHGIENFLRFVNANWTTICVIIGLAIGLYHKIRAFMAKSDEEKIFIAKEQIKQIMLRMVGKAELDYAEWNKAGSVKRSQVIEEIYKRYPILAKAVDQDGLVHWIDHQIDVSLETLAEVIKANETTEVAEQE